jgi:hypothetical protein
VNRSVAFVIAALIAALAAIGLLTGGEQAGQPAEAGSSGPSLEQVARGVERVRELEFDRLPRVKPVSAGEARRAGLRQLDSQVSRAEQEAEEQLLKLLGLLPPDARIRELLGRALAGEVGGYYLPGTDTLHIVRGAGLGGLFADVVLAHELTHALEDQRFGISPEAGLGFRRDRAVAQSALVEGSATLVMVDYLALTRAGRDDISPELRARALEGLEGVAVPSSSGLPRYLREGLIFPYSRGALLVNEIEGGGGWEAVDRALGREPPLSTEQVMHPGKYMARERPVRVRLGGLRAALPAGARRLSRGDLGEFDTEQFLREANGRARSGRAAQGWGGGGFELWRLPGPPCEGACRERHVLALGWAWDTARDAAEFEEAARRALDQLGAAGAIRRAGGDRVLLVLAPKRRLAESIARRLAE